MFTLRPGAGNLGLALTATAFALHLSVAQAVPFTTDITISGENSLDNPFSTGGTGDFSMVSGGTSTTSTFDANSVVTGADPIIGSLTDISDGFSLSGTATTDNIDDDYFSFGMDTSLNLSNTSASDSYEVVFKLSYSNTVNADGVDAWSTSEFSVNENVAEIFNSYLISDSLYGDADNSGDLGTFGDVLVESGDEFFAFVLNPLDILSLDMDWTAEGEDLTDNGLSEISFFASLSVYSVEQFTVPLPGTFILVGMGLILIPLQRRMRSLLKV